MPWSPPIRLKHFAAEIAQQARTSKHPAQAISFKASSNLRWHKIREFGTRKDVYNRYAVEQDQIFQTCTCTGCLDVWIPGCLSPGHLHAHHFFTQTAAAPSLERKLAVAVDPQSQRAGEWNLPNSLGGFGNQVNLRSLNPALFCEISDLNKVPDQDGLHAFVSYQSEQLSAAKKTSVSLYFYLMGRVHFRTNLYYLLHLHDLLSSQTQGSWENVGTNVADEIRTSSSWQERLEHRSEEFLMRS